MSVDTRFESDRFRHVLGHFPTGVAAVTAIGTTGAPTGIAVGSFTSVSLTPPLVAFLPDKASTTFPQIRSAGSFCINVLSAGQEDVCRSFAAKGGDKFGSIGWTPAASGAPILDGVLAWIDCEIDAVHEAGDHYIVVGRVLDLDVGDAATHSPLVFFRGGYARVGASTLVDLP